MDKKNVSKIKHLSLRSKNSSNIDKDIIKDSVDINDTGVKMVSEPSETSNSQDFFSQTINFKSGKNEGEVSVADSIASEEINCGDRPLF